MSNIHQFSLSFRYLLLKNIKEITYFVIWLLNREYYFYYKINLIIVKI